MIDTLVIGAGAAGIAAAHKLHDLGKNVLILEARNRIGGRIHTHTTSTDYPLELGAEFIHGDQAVTHDLVKQAGLSVIPVVRLGNLWWGDPHALPLPQLAADLRAEIDGLLYAYHRLQWDQADISLADYLKLQGWAGAAPDRADVLLAQTCCTTLDRLSCADLIREMRVDHAGKGEARIREGYAALLNWYSRDLPIQLRQPVQAIQWGKTGVTVITASATYHAQNCILTLPPPLLKTIQFDPPLPADKLAAISSFTTDPATKLIYQFHEPLWDESLTYMAHQGAVPRWWTPGYGRPGAATISAFITSARAAVIDRMAEGAAIHAGLQELSTLLNVPLTQLEKTLIKARRIAWADDPYAQGGYAHVEIGQAEARERLARPLQDRLFFAGEATAYDSNPQTVHGAIESGWRAAGECLGV